MQTMGRKKIEDRTTVLTHLIRTRVDDKTFNRLSAMVKSSNCKTVGQVARKILSQNRIKVYRKDKSLEEPVQQLIQIRNELRAVQVMSTRSLATFMQLKQETGGCLMRSRWRKPIVRWMTRSRLWSRWWPNLESYG